MALLSFIMGCPSGVPEPNGQDPNTNNNPPSDRARDCAGCHTDENLLKAVATEEEAPTEDAGEG